VHALLRTYMAERELGDGLAYWAPTGSRQLEVDFVLSRGDELCALEVKAAHRVHPGDFADLRAVGELPGLRRRVLLHRGERPTRTEDGIDAWPVATFLEALESDRLWDER
jgi:predicted AAA+ superfamily ATPase